MIFKSNYIIIVFTILCFVLSKLFVNLLGILFTFSNYTIQAKSLLMQNWQYEVIVSLNTIRYHLFKLVQITVPFQLFLRLI